MTVQGTPPPAPPFVCMDHTATNTAHGCCPSSLLLDTRHVVLVEYKAQQYVELRLKQSGQASNLPHVSRARPCAVFTPFQPLLARHVPAAMPDQTPSPAFGRLDPAVHASLQPLPLTAAPPPEQAWVVADCRAAPYPDDLATYKALSVAHAPVGGKRGVMGIWHAAGG